MNPTGKETEKDGIYAEPYLQIHDYSLEKLDEIIRLTDEDIAYEAENIKEAAATVARFQARVDARREDVALLRAIYYKKKMESCIQEAAALNELRVKKMKPS